MEKKQVKYFVIDLDDEIHEDPYIDGSFNNDLQILNEKVWNDISNEEVYKIGNSILYMKHKHFTTCSLK